MTLTSAGLVRGEEAAPFGEMSLLDESTPLQVGDRILYRVYEDRDPPIALYVNDRGEIDAPVLGWTEASGLTCKELAFAIKEKLEVDFYKRATVIISLYELPQNQDLTLSMAIMRAGGFTRFANQRNVKVIRSDTDLGEEEKILSVNVSDVLEKGNRSIDPILNPEDIIRVEERWIAL